MCVGVNLITMVSKWFRRMWVTLIFMRVVHIWLWIGFRSIYWVYFADGRVWISPSSHFNWTSSVWRRRALRLSWKRAWLVWILSHGSGLPAACWPLSIGSQPLAAKARWHLAMAVPLIVGTSILKNLPPVHRYSLHFPTLLGSAHDLCFLCLFSFLASRCPALIVFNSEVRSCTVSGVEAAATATLTGSNICCCCCCCGVGCWLFVFVCVCCLLIMIMMIEIVFSPCFFFLASFCVFMLCPFVAELSWWSSCLLSVSASRASPPRSQPCVFVVLLFIYFIPLRSTPKKTNVN